MNAQYHWQPDNYLEMMHAEIPRYDELQAAAVSAIPFEPKTVLELGVGTAETTERIWQRFPDCRITGLDSSPDMVFRARELGWEEIRLGRIEDPLPDGPWDLVIGVLVVHHLDADGKRDLFRRVREQSRALVIGDVVTVDDPESLEHRTPVDPNYDKPSSAADQAEWCGGEIVWAEDDLAVIRASY